MNLWPIAYAAGLPFLDKAKTAIIQPIIWFLMSAALVVFLYGVYEMIAEGSNPEKRSVGQQHVLWGLIGLVIMVSAFGILNLICNTIHCS